MLTRRLMVWLPWGQSARQMYPPSDPLTADPTLPSGWIVSTLDIKHKFCQSATRTHQCLCSFKLSATTQLVGHQQDKWSLSYNEGNAEKCEPLSYKISAPVSLISAEPCLSMLFICLESKSDCFLGLLKGSLFVTGPGHLQTTCCLDSSGWTDVCMSTLAASKYSQYRICLSHHGVLKMVSMGMGSLRLGRKHSNPWL